MIDGRSGDLKLLLGQLGLVLSLMPLLHRSLGKVLGQVKVLPQELILLLEVVLLDCIFGRHTLLHLVKHLLLGKGLGDFPLCHELRLDVLHEWLLHHLHVLPLQVRKPLLSKGLRVQEAILV